MPQRMADRHHRHADQQQEEDRREAHQQGADAESADARGQKYAPMPSNRIDDDTARQHDRSRHDLAHRQNDADTDAAQPERALYLGQHHDRALQNPVEHGMTGRETGHHEPRAVSDVVVAFGRRFSGRQ